MVKMVVEGFLKPMLAMLVANIALVLLIASVGIIYTWTQMRKKKRSKKATGVVRQPGVASWWEQEVVRDQWAVLVRWGKDEGLPNGTVEVALYNPLGFFDFDRWHAAFQLTAPLGVEAPVELTKLHVLDPRKDEDFHQKVEIAVSPLEPYSFMEVLLDGLDPTAHAGKWLAEATFYFGDNRVEVTKEFEVVQPPTATG